MPGAIIPLPDVYETIIRKVAVDSISQISTSMNIPSSAKVYLPGRSESVPMNDGLFGNCCDSVSAVYVDPEEDVKPSAQPGEWYFHEGEWYYCTVDHIELKDICSAFLDDTNPNQIRTVTRNGQSHDIPLNNIDTRYVTTMSSMFYQATNFNQDLSKWCVTNIRSKPTNFDANSALTTENLPIWGTCPNG